MTYTIKTHPHGTEYIEQDLGNGVKVMFGKDPANSDYQRYLAWLENPEAALSTPIVSSDAN